LATSQRQFIVDDTARIGTSEVSGVSQAAGKQAAGQIRKETLKKRISNIE